MSEKEYLPGSIRDRIVDLKRTHNMTNKLIAERTGLSESLLSRIESGKQQTVNDDVVLALAKCFNVSTDFLLGRTEVPDRKNYTIEDLGLSAQAARSLYTGSVDVRVINLLLAEPEFVTLTQMIADYFDDTYASAIATQNQIHQSTAELLSASRVRTSSAGRWRRPWQSRCGAQCTPLYKTELAQMGVQFERALRAVKKELPQKAEAAKAMTKEAFDHLRDDLTKDGNALDILTITPEQIARSICEYVSPMDGVTEEMKENFYRAVLPVFHVGGTDDG